MSLPSLPETLKGGVGRRILGFFVLAGIVPVLFTAGLAYVEISRGLDAEIHRSLRERAKEYGLDVLARLQRSSGASDQIVRIVRDEGADSLATHQFALTGIAGVWQVDAAGGTRPLFGNEHDIVDLSHWRDRSAALPRLASGRDATGGYIIHLRRIDSGPAAGTIVAVRPQNTWLWGRPQDLPYAMEFCVFAKRGLALNCSVELSEADQRGLAAVAGQGNILPIETRTGDGYYLAAAWPLFLAGEFGELGETSLDIVARQSKDIALQSRANFARIYLPSLGLVVILVGLLSFNMIGRSLVPLRRLTRAADTLAGGNLDARVRIESTDEFAVLGDAFNDMAGRLSQQFAALQAMSDLDRRILSGAPFEEVSECVLRHLQKLTNASVSAIIARDRDAPHWARLITTNGRDVVHERIAMPADMNESWYQVRRVRFGDGDSGEVPYEARLRTFGVDQVTLIPVIQDGALNGMLLLGWSGDAGLTADQEKQCIDLAGSFGVALASAEREEALYRQAHYDELTGLPNRQLLKDRLERQIVQAKREETLGAVLFLDLDRFKKINDVHGHSTGDVVLKQAAERILAEVRDSDTVARLGGDEFVVMLNHVENDSRVRAMASRLLERMTESFSVRGQDHFVGASIGIAMFPEDGDSVETLLKHADAAMYRAKDAGRARFEFCSQKLNAESRRKLELERDLRIAHRQGELEVWYQPQFSLEHGHVSGAEALLRWRHPREGWVSPAEFIPLAEESNLVVDIGRWVIDRVCADLRRLLDLDLHPGSLSVNVSARQLRESSLVADVFQPIQRHAIHPGYLQLEVTETTVAENRDTAIEILQAIREEGVRIAIDDFGTGYSSLSYLQQMPFDAIKIDKSFVDRVGRDEASDNICRTIILMADQLQKKSIAEGVETSEQAGFLRRHRCDTVQGFYFSKPLSRDSFFRFVQDQDRHTQRREALEIV